MINKAEKVILYITVFLLAVLVLPITSNIFVLPKLILLGLAIILLLGLKVTEIILTQSFKIKVSRYDLPVLILAAAYLSSGLLRTPNNMEVFLLPGNGSIILAGVFLYFFINQLDRKAKANLVQFLVFSGLAVSLISLFALSGMLTQISWLGLGSPYFSSIGGSLPAVIFLGLNLLLGLHLLFKDRGGVKKVFWFVCLVVLGFGMLISLLPSLPEKWQFLAEKVSPPQLLDFRTSWEVMIDTFKESPILGIGPGNYLTAFNRFRSVNYNNRPTWALKFNSSRSFYLTLLTETGLLGLIGLGLLVLILVQEVKRMIGEGSLLKQIGTNLLFWSLIGYLIILAFFPAPLVLVITLFILLALNSQGKTINLILGQSESKSLAAKVPALISTLPIVVGMILFLFFGSKAVLAEMTYKRSLDLLIKNDAQGTYNTLIQAISLNPYVDRYHLTYAQINMILAQAISQKEEVTEEDRNMIAQLIQQAIREGKAVVVLNPQRSDNWRVLGIIYQNIMPFAQGADTFTVQTLTQATVLDPVNPNLRIDLGGVYYALGDYDSAIESFKLAVLAKSDLANAHYNLAAAYREKGEIDKAINQMTLVLSLVEPNSADYTTAKNELESLEQRRATPEAAEEAESLTPPQPAEKPVIEPPLDLPEEASPPAGPEFSPEASPTPLPEEE